MSLRTIPIDNLRVKCHDLWDNKWLLLTSGDYIEGKFNAMTVGWGSLGMMWNLPFVQVVVRPTRYTYQFMEQYDTFTLCAFPEENRDALRLLGTKSGRDSHKIKDSGLTPTASSIIAAPGYAEAELIIECHKIYFADFIPGQFLKPSIDQQYPKKDYHRIYFGEIVAVLGENSYI